MELLQKKNLLIFELSTAYLLKSISIQPPHPIGFQLIQNSPLLIINNISNKIQVIDYRKGCLLKTLDLKYKDIFLNGIIYDTIEYFSKNIKSLNIWDLSKLKIYKLNFTENNTSEKKKIKIQEISTNIFSNSIFYSSILLALDRKYFLWDRFTRLVILN